MNNSKIKQIWKIHTMAIVDSNKVLIGQTMESNEHFQKRGMVALIVCVGPY